MELKILKAIIYFGNRAATWHIANHIGMRGKTAKVLTIMKNLEKSGWVKKHIDSTSNNYIWIVTEPGRAEVNKIT